MGPLQRYSRFSEKTPSADAVFGVQEAATVEGMTGGAREKRGIALYTSNLIKHTVYVTYILIVSYCYLIVAQFIVHNMCILFICIYLPIDTIAGIYSTY